MRTPNKLMGFRVPEAGEYIEKVVCGGLVTFRLSNNSATKARHGWVPQSMEVTAVLLKRDRYEVVALCDSDIGRLFVCVQSNEALPTGFLLNFDTKQGRKKGEHALKRTDG
jgi:hypothetical protein